MNEDRLVLSATELKPTKYNFQRCIDCVDIARRSSARGHQTMVRWQKQVFIHTRLSRTYLALARFSDYSFHPLNIDSISPTPRLLCNRFPPAGCPRVFLLLTLPRLNFSLLVSNSSFLKQTTLYSILLILHVSDLVTARCTLDAKEGRVDISDCSYEAVAAMLKFMYCDIPPELDNISPKELLTVADKYDVPGLRRVCERQISRNVDVTTAAHTLQLADDYKAPYLRQCALAFIAQNLKAVLATEGWHEVTLNRPDFLNAVLNSVALHMT